MYIEIFSNYIKYNISVMRLDYHNYISNAWNKSKNVYKAILVILDFTCYEDVTKILLQDTSTFTEATCNINKRVLIFYQTYILQ